MARSSAATPAGRCGTGTRCRRSIRAMIDYARANASIGINGVVLNNVNADAQILTPEYLRKVAALAERLAGPTASASFSPRASARRSRSAASTPPTRSTQRVRAWWRAKADEIYRAHPRLRRLPGQGQFRRPARAAGLRAAPMPTAPTCSPTRSRRIGGIVDVARLRLFGESQGGPRQAGVRRVHAARRQVPRPTSSSRSRTGRSTSSRASRSTRCSAQCRTRRSRCEVQITEEYLGQNARLVLPRPDVVGSAATADTCSPRCGSPVADATIAAMAGVANIGSDRNWTGSDFDQANWYAFGRLAWNPSAARRDRSPRNGRA